MIKFIIFALIAYVIGSVTTAVIVSKYLGLPDPRKHGSQNPGATNVLRLGGRQAAILTLLGDALKGFLSVMIARLFGIDGFLLGLIAVFALVGHLFPLFFRFKGGKGVATAFGAICGLSLPIAILLLLTWLIVVLFSRYSSLAALIAAIAAPIYALFFGDFAYFLPLIAISVLIIWRHWGNIQRLKAGVEPKISF